MSKLLKDNSRKDFKKSWICTSRFLFYVSILGTLAFVSGACYRLYQQRYMGKPNVEIQSSTKYTPEYK